MSTHRIKVGTENSTDIELHYEDLGSGPVVVLIHGWPLSGRSWEKQTLTLLAAGYRVITYDRRGFGHSSQPSFGYDYDTFAADLDVLVRTLGLTDFALAGFSMGGGEVARYYAKYGKGLVRKAAFLGAVPPYLAKADDNPQGVDPAVFAGIQQALRKDRPGFLAGFLQNFFNVDALGGSRISEQVVTDCWNIAVGASPKGTHDCVAAWGTDFRQDLAAFDIPVLVIHGDSDRIVPLEISGQLTHERVPGSRLVVLKDAPHGFTATHADEVNAALLEFLAE